MKALKRVASCCSALEACIVSHAWPWLALCSYWHGWGGLRPSIIGTLTLLLFSPTGTSFRFPLIRDYFGVQTLLVSQEARTSSNSSIDLLISSTFQRQSRSALELLMSTLACFSRYCLRDPFLWNSIPRIVISLRLWSRLLFEGFGSSPTRWNDAQNRSYIRISFSLSVASTKISSIYRPKGHLKSVCELPSFN